MGALYQNLVQPTYDSCIMRRVDYPGFCPVCKRALTMLLEYYASLTTLTVSIGITGVEVRIDGALYETYNGVVFVTLEEGYHRSRSIDPKPVLPEDAMGNLY